jgi:hypothetical protein
MPILPIISQAKGPLPISVNFNAPSDAPACFVLSGSGWCPSTDQIIGVTLQLDGTSIGSAAIWSNQHSIHRAFVPAYIPVTLTFGQHTVKLVASNGNTTTDLNDFFNVVLDY